MFSFEYMWNMPYWTRSDFHLLCQWDYVLAQHCTDPGHSWIVCFQYKLILWFSGDWSAAAKNARLYQEDNASTKRIGGWCATDRDNQFVGVDLGKEMKVTAIATQGKRIKMIEITLQTVGLPKVSWCVRSDYSCVCIWTSHSRQVWF